MYTMIILFVYKDNPCIFVHEDNLSIELTPRYGICSAHIRDMDWVVAGYRTMSTTQDPMSKTSATYL